MKHFFLLITIVALNTLKSYSQDTLYSEDFESGTSGWVLNSLDNGSNAPNGINNWVVNTDYTGGTYLVFGFLSVTLPDMVSQPATVKIPNQNYLHIAYASGNTFGINEGSAAFAVFDGTFIMADKNFVKMNAGISTIGKSGVELKFHEHAYGGLGYVLYSINGGSSWIQLGGAKNATLGTTVPWTETTITDAAFDNVADLRIAFMFDNAASGTVQDPSFSIDQIYIVSPTTSTTKVVGSLDSQTNILCKENTTGTATVSAIGTATISYQWKNATNGGGANIGSNSVTISNIAAGDYSVIITDGVPSKDTVNVTITEPSTKVALVTSNVTDISCFSLTDGSVDLSSTGGTGATQYSLDGTAFSTVTSFDTLVNGNNEIWVKDANGCRDSTNVNVIEPLALNVDILNPFRFS